MFFMKIKVQWILVSSPLGCVGSSLYNVYDLCVFEPCLGVLGCLSLLFILSINIFNFYKKTVELAVVSTFCQNVDTCHD